MCFKKAGMTNGEWLAALYKRHWILVGLFWACATAGFSGPARRRAASIWRCKTATK